MNLTEFKAFIEGLEHAFRGEAPNAEQWQLIKDMLYQVGKVEKRLATGEDIEKILKRTGSAETPRGGVSWPRMDRPYAHPAVFEQQSTQEFHAGPDVITGVDLGAPEGDYTVVTRRGPD